jgi:hypothetical protein
MMLFYRSKTDQLWMIRIGRLCLQGKGPQYKPLFSEQYGYKKPFLRVRGWRFFLFLVKRF